MSEPCPHCKSPNCRAFGRGHNAEPDDVTVCRLRNEREDLRGGLELATERIATLEAELTELRQAWPHMVESMRVKESELASMRQRAEAAERENAALNNLMAMSVNESVFSFSYAGYGEPVCIWRNDEPREVGEGATVGAAAIVLARRLGLLPDDAKPEAAPSGRKD